MAKVILDEEAKPRPEPKEKMLYNSPPSFSGRYFLVNSFERPIQTSDYIYLKNNHLMSYWNSEYLEDMDMFYDAEGWRLTGEAIPYLRQRGYTVEITTVEQKQEAERKAKEALKEKRRLEEIEAKKLDDRYDAIVKQINETLKGITFHGQHTEKKFEKNDYLEDSPQFRIGGSNPDKYQTYGLTKDKRVFIFTKQFFDMWGSDCSDQKAPKQYIELIKKLQKEELEA